jgi:hypothetical protein
MALPWPCHDIATAPYNNIQQILLSVSASGYSYRSDMKIDVCKYQNVHTHFGSKRVTVRPGFFPAIRQLWS